ncbi:thioredoxin [Coniochaeta sp. 2T2.1]|nr:thioredoxin [Coniochaeta sp. 2T2.1]
MVTSPTTSRLHPNPPLETFPEVKMTTTFTVEIYSDTLCPFCYIGKKSLDSAISLYQSRHPDVSFKLIWRPFLIHPKFRGKVPNKRDYFKAKYGAAQAEGLFKRLEERGRRLGIDFSWDGASGSSWDSHKLILAAGDRDRLEEEEKAAGREEEEREGGWGGRQKAMLDGLFRGVFEEGRDVSDHQFLAEVAVNAGVVETVEEAERVMADEEMGRRVEWESAQGRKREIEAVPSYLVQGRYFVGGMQEPEVFEEVFGRVVRGKESGRVAAREGEVCHWAEKA